MAGKVNMSFGISAAGIKKAYGTGLSGKGRIVEAVGGVSFTVKHGGAFGLIGPSGCGKSTVARIVAGILKPDSGTVEVNGMCGFVSQDPYSSLSPVMRLEAVVAEPLIFGGKAKNTRACSDEVRGAMAKVQLDYKKYRRRLPSELSGGERQRAAIARALIGKPRVLILDEPVSMLDYDVKYEIMDILQNLVSENNYAILLISHDIGFVKDLCTYIAVMDSGLIIEEGTPEQICGSPREELTQKLVMASLDLKKYLG